MMKINKTTMPKMLSFLVQCQIDCAKIGRAWSPTGTERDMKIGHGRFNAAVECGFFEKSGDRWVCRVKSFDTDHALKVIQKANEYIERKKSERELRGHIPTPRKSKTSTPAPAPELKPKPEQSEIPFKKPAGDITNPNPAQPADVTKLNTQQFVDAFKQSKWIAECKRRGFGVALTFNTKIEL